jgi:hypothetical protein
MDFPIITDIRYVTDINFAISHNGLYIIRILSDDMPWYIKSILSES